MDPTFMMELVSFAGRNVKLASMEPIMDVFLAILNTISNYRPLNAYAKPKIIT